MRRDCFARRTVNKSLRCKVWHLRYHILRENRAVREKLSREASLDALTGLFNRGAYDLLQHPTDDLPPVSLSVGVAFADRENPQGDIFHDADTALYKVKAAGRKGCGIYGE